MDIDVWIRDPDKETDVSTVISPILRHTLTSICRETAVEFQKNETRLAKLLHFILEHRDMQNMDTIAYKLKKDKYSKALRYLSRVFRQHSNVIRLIQQNWAKLTAPKSITYIEQLQTLLYEFSRYRCYSKQYGYVSTLWAGDLPLMTVTATYVDGSNSYKQVYIMRVVSTFFYQTLVNATCAPPRVSILLHSITAYAMKQKFPDLIDVVIPIPLFNMSDILAKASQQYRFKIQDEDGSKLIALDEFASIWRQWSSASSADLFCNSCLKPAAFMCSETYLGYCNRECQYNSTINTKVEEEEE